MCQNKNSHDRGIDLIHMSKREHVSEYKPYTVIWLGQVFSFNSTKLDLNPYAWVQLEPVVHDTCSCHLTVLTHQPCDF